MALQRLDDRIMVIDHRPTARKIGVRDVRPHLQPQPSQDAGQHRKPGNRRQHEVKGLVELRALQTIAGGNRLLVFAYDLLQRLNIRTRCHLRRRLCRKPLEPHADGADLAVARLAQAGDADIPRGPEGDRLVIDEPEDGVADRSDAGAELLGEIANLQTVAGLEPPLHQRVAERAVNDAVEVRVFQCRKLGHRTHPQEIKQQDT